mmetsp:Transcript_45327/g.145859  ORF Transcript_45327/g.145859 Transcript_45327/m.145859 type:complete len:261 (+) Transcript_45327:345-1127(+)
MSRRARRARGRRAAPAAPPPPPPTPAPDAAAPPAAPSACRAGTTFTSRACCSGCGRTTRARSAGTRSSRTRPRARRPSSRCCTAGAKPPTQTDPLRAAAAATGGREARAAVGTEDRRAGPRQRRRHLRLLRWPCIEAAARQESRTWPPKTTRRRECSGPRPCSAPCGLRRAWRLGGHAAAVAGRRWSPPPRASPQPSVPSASRRATGTQAAASPPHQSAPPRGPPAAPRGPRAATPCRRALRGRHRRQSGDRPRPPTRTP